MMKPEQTTLFPTDDPQPTTGTKQGKTTERVKRIDTDSELRKLPISYCRLNRGAIWQDGVNGHRVGVLDATHQEDIDRLMGGEKTGLIINDPPYNVAVGSSNTANLSKIDLASYLDFSKRWISCAHQISKPKTHLYIWMGADYKEDFQPLPDFMILMREFPDFRPRNFIALRNQRGYGTQKNWMWVWKELLHYVRGEPDFTVTYTEIPKTLRGYDKEGRWSDDGEPRKKPVRNHTPRQCVG